jgi:cell wall-associated NlpC family hydrolase/lipopolysaccharide export LptBFGC system permease protein LptF
MPKEIKIKHTVKDIKLLDKAASGTAHVKNAFVKSKDAAESTQQAAHDKAENYASDKMEGGAKSAAQEAASRFKHPQTKARQNAEKAKEHFAEAKRNLPGQRKAAAEKAKKTAENAKNTADNLGKTADQTRKTAEQAQRAVIDAKRAFTQTRQMGRQSVQAAKQTVKTAKQADKTIKTAGRAAKSTAKGTIKTVRKSVKTAERTARTTVKTAQKTAKAAQQSAKAAAKAAKMAAQVSKAAAKATVQTAKAATKAVIAMVKAAIAAIKGLVSLIAAGGWVAVLVIIIICLIGLLAGSVFGIFFSNESSDVTMTEVVTQINREFSDRIERIQNDNPHDYLVLNNSGNSTLAANWRDVLAVYAVKTAGNEQNGMEVATLDDEKIAILREIFWDMNEITYSVTTTTTPPESITDDPVDDENSETEEDEDAGPVTYTVLTITVTSKGQAEMRTAYHFTDRQNAMLDELLLPEYQSLFMQLTGSYVNISLSPEEVAALMENLPQNIDERRKAVVAAAYSLIGKVNYFWGGKSTTIGWDSRWGTPTKVTSSGSPTTGTVRPFGLDCSGYVTWAFCNAAGASDAVNIIRHGTSNQYANSHKIDWSELMPGDIVFFDFKSPHVGIVIGKKANGNVIIAHCASSRNNVVVDEYSGPKSNGFCLPARPYFYD